MNRSSHHGFPSQCTDLWTVLCRGGPQSMASSKGVKTSTILFVSRIRTTGYTWPPVLKTPAHLKTMDCVQMYNRKVNIRCCISRFFY